MGNLEKKTDTKQSDHDFLLDNIEQIIENSNGAQYVLIKDQKVILYGNYNSIKNKSGLCAPIGDHQWAEVLYDEVQERNMKNIRVLYQENQNFFAQNIDKLEQKYINNYVVIKDKKVIDTSRNLFKLKRIYKDKDIFIDFVDSGEERNTIDLSGSMEISDST